MSNITPMQSLVVRVTPNARKSEVLGWGADEKGRPVLLIKLAAPPVEGKDDSAEPPPVVFDEKLQDRMWQETRVHASAVNWNLVERVVTQTRGIAVPVTKRGLTYDSYLASARRVETELPAGSNWDGNDGPPPKGEVKPMADSGVRARR